VVTGPRLLVPGRLGLAGLGVAGAGAGVPVEGAGGVVAGLHGPGLASLAGDGDLASPRVKVAAPLVTRVVAEAGWLGQPGAGGGQDGDDRGVAALREAPAGAGALQPGQLVAGEEGAGLPGTCCGRGPVTGPGMPSSVASHVKDNGLRRAGPSGGCGSAGARADGEGRRAPAEDDGGVTS
jgi:hypothetical protein